MGGRSVGTETDKQNACQVFSLSLTDEADVKKATLTDLVVDLMSHTGHFVEQTQ